MGITLKHAFRKIILSAILKKEGFLQKYGVVSMS
jgi:hypothetical protein